MCFDWNSGGCHCCRNETIVTWGPAVESCVRTCGIKYLILYQLYVSQNILWSHPLRNTWSSALLDIFTYIYIHLHIAISICTLLHHTNHEHRSSGMCFQPPSSALVTTYCNIMWTDEGLDADPYTRRTIRYTKQNNQWTLQASEGLWSISDVNRDAFIQIHKWETPWRHMEWQWKQKADGAGHRQDQNINRKHMENGNKDRAWQREAEHWDETVAQVEMQMSL